jgi:hypothetical protein
MAVRCGECRWWKYIYGLTDPNRRGICLAPVPIAYKYHRADGTTEDDGDGCPIYENNER